MTVAELIAKLQEMPQGLDVYVADDEYGPDILMKVQIEKLYAHPAKRTKDYPQEGFIEFDAVLLNR